MLWGRSKKEKCHGLESAGILDHIRYHCVVNEHHSVSSYRFRPVESYIASAARDTEWQYHSPALDHLASA